jgi:hypothetical protein
MTSRPSSFAPLLTIAAILLLPLGAYVASYFWLGEYSDLKTYGRYRVFENDPLKTIYLPMAFLESKFRGDEVTAMSWDEWGNRLEIIVNSAPVIDPEA